jgi:sugar lactone lactonase YvrE
MHKQFFSVIVMALCLGSFSSEAFSATFNQGLAQPESILYDEKRDVYWVSNINGEATVKDNNGYISQIKPNGQIADLYFFKGGSNGIELNAPKGMAIHGNILWVTDIDVIRRFDLRLQKPYGEPIPIEGATFLNDIVSLPDGGVFVTDSGLNPDFSTSKTDAIYFIRPNGRILPIAKNEQLNNPNGIELANGQLIIVAFHPEASIYSINPQGGKENLITLPKGDLDGIKALKKGALLISSWDLGGIYLIKPNKEIKVIAENLSSPADIGFDSKRNLVLVPLLNKNQIQIFPLK